MAWQLLDVLGNQYRVAPPTPSDGDCAICNGELHVVFNDGSELVHSIRYADGKWSPFGNIQDQLWPNRPRDFESVACDGEGSDLVVASGSTRDNGTDVTFYSIRAKPDRWTATRMRALPGWAIGAQLRLRMNGRRHLLFYAHTGSMMHSVDSVEWHTIEETPDDFESIDVALNENGLHVIACAVGRIYHCINAQTDFQPVPIPVPGLGPAACDFFDGELLIYAQSLGPVYLIRRRRNGEWYQVRDEEDTVGKGL